MPMLSRRMDSELGQWTHTVWTPGRGHLLAGAVERVWDFDGALVLPRERVFPNGMVQLIVQLDEPHRDVLDTGTVLTPATCVTGIQTRAIVVESPRSRCRVIGVRLHPAGAWRVLAHPLWELADRTSDLDGVLGSAAREVAERCHDAVSGGERVRRVIVWLEGRLLRQPAGAAADPAACWVAERIATSRGRAPIAPLREEAGLNGSRLTALFREQIGTTPKRYARIQRLNLALRMLRRSCADLAGVALDAGYYDQPHMNAEFRAMAGISPGEFRAAVHYPDSENLAEPA